MSSRIIPIHPGDDLPDIIERGSSPLVINQKGDPMRIVYKGNIIKTALPTGGKAGKGNNKTSTIQVIDPEGYLLKKSVRYTVEKPGDLMRAIKRAKDWIDGKEPIRGGARAGSGPKKKLSGGSRTVTYLDGETRETFRDLGDGNLSEGARRAAKIAREAKEES